MAQIPSYAQWKKDTYSLRHRRSDFLKKVDSAVEAYDKSKSDVTRGAIKNALDRWRFEQSRQGKDWRKSVRNQKGAVTHLHRAVSDLDRRKLSKEELEAMEYIGRMQSMALQKQFLGQKVTFKSDTVVGMAQNAGSNWKKFKTGAATMKSGATMAKGVHKNAKAIHSGAALLRKGGRGAAAQASQAQMAGNFASIKMNLRKFCSELCPGLNPDKVFKALNLGGVEKFASDVAPFVGAISSGGKAVAGWIGVAKTGWQKHSIGGTRYAFAPNDPEAAFDALLVLLDREITSKSVQAGVNTAAFSGKLLGAFADAGAVTGPVVGLMETLASICQTIVEYVRDYKETQVANELLRVGALNLDLFSVSPILGCYFLVAQDHSTIINFAVGDYGTPNWMFDVERLIKKIDPVLTKSRQYIQLSRVEIVGFQTSKGVVEQNWKVKGKAAKVAGLPAHVKDSIGKTIDAWIEKPEKPPKVDKSRIIGFGPGQASIGVGSG